MKIEMLASGEYTTRLWDGPGSDYDTVELFEITTAHGEDEAFNTIGYVYSDLYGEEIVRRCNAHEALVQALAEARALIQEAEGNSHVLDWDGTDCVLEMIEKVLKGEEVGSW